MVITIIGFSTVTFVTGLLPTLQTVGIVAPILLIILRFVQGLFAGGEWASGSVITMEMVPKKTRGLLSGFLQSGYTFGFLMASIVFPDSITHLYRRILCRSWLETNVLYSYWTQDCYLY